MHFGFDPRTVDQFQLDEFDTLARQADHINDEIRRANEQARRR